jgi:hypothetical protein
MIRLFWAIRVFVKHWLAECCPIIEFCKDCGCCQPVVWTADDELWAEVVLKSTPSGRDIPHVLCPNCFDRRATKIGFFIRWVPKVEYITKGPV